MVGFLERFASQFSFEHVEVVGDDQADLLFAPVLVRRLLLFGTRDGWCTPLFSRKRANTLN